MKREKRKNGEALMCGCCTYPFAYMQAGKLVVTSRHGSQQHTNALTPDELRALASELESGVKNGVSLLPTERYNATRLDYLTEERAEQ